MQINEALGSDHPPGVTENCQITHAIQLGSYAGIKIYVINITEDLTYKLDEENKHFSLLSYKNRGLMNNTSQQDFGTRKVYCVSNVTFHAESKYAINIFPSPTVFVQWPF